MTSTTETALTDLPTERPIASKYQWSRTTGTSTPRSAMSARSASYSSAESGSARDSRRGARIAGRIVTTDQHASPQWPRPRRGFNPPRIAASDRPSDAEVERARQQSRRRWMPIVRSR